MRFLCGLALTLLLLVPSFAQTRVLTPAPGSPMRKAVLDALRVPVEKELGQAVVFKVDVLRVQGDWAFVRGVPQRPDGGAIDYTRTPYQEVRELGAFDDNFSALLRKDDGKWVVVVHSIGATDVAWEPWSDEYKAPKTIFG